MTKSINHSWLAVVGLCLVAGAITAWRHRREHVAKRVTSICAVLVLASLLAAAYLTLACAKVAPGTALRADIIFGIFYPMIVIAVMGLGILLEYHPQIKTALPVFAFFMLCLCNTQGRTYANSNMLKAPESTVRELDRQIVEQCTTAAREGKNEVVLEVPKANSPDNFPYALYGGERISATLTAHGVIDRDITITFIPTEEKSNEMGAKL